MDSSWRNFSCSNVLKTCGYAHRYWLMMLCYAEHSKFHIRCWTWSIWAPSWAAPWGRNRMWAGEYRSGVVLAPTDILLTQDNLVGELRRIGNNINQLAKLGHIHAKKSGGIGASSDDRIGQECLRQFERLERAVLKFENAIPDYAASAFDPKAKQWSSNQCRAKCQHSGNSPPISGRINPHSRVRLFVGTSIMRVMMKRQSAVYFQKTTNTSQNAKTAMRFIMRF